MATQNKTDIGLIGLAVMGENLALNMESRGWSVSVYNRTVPGVEEGVVERFTFRMARSEDSRSSARWRRIRACCCLMSRLPA